MGVMLLLLQAVVHSNVLIRMSKSQGIALTIVRNELENVRSGGYAATPPSGSFQNSLLSTLPVGATTTRTVNAYNNNMKRVSASVVWREPGASASSTVSLETLIIDTGGI